MSGVDNPPAFPTSSIDGFTQHGMTLRDWFAGQALVGLLASTNYTANPHGYTGDAAHDAFAIADAMLTARASGDTAIGGDRS